MSNGRDDVAELERKLEEAYGRVDETTAAIDTAEAALASMRAERDESVDDPAFYAKLGVALNDHRSELDRLKLVLGKRQNEAEQLEDELARARYRAAADAANSAGERVVKASETVAGLVDQLASAFDKLASARARHRDARAQALELHVSDEPSALLEVEEAYSATDLRALIDFLADEREQQLRRNEVSFALQRSASEVKRLAAARERAEAIVEKAYADADGGRPQFNELVGSEGLDVKSAVQRLVHERERERRRELNPVP